MNEVKWNGNSVWVSDQYILLDTQNSMNCNLSFMEGEKHPIKISYASGHATVYLDNPQRNIYFLFSIFSSNGH